MSVEWQPGKVGKLNSFQKTMLQWNALHPYNAIHVARVPESLEPDRLSRTIQELLKQSGLGLLRIHARRGTYQYTESRENCDVRIIEGAGDALTVLLAEIERQLNTGFEIDRPFCPFRFFAVREREKFHVGAVYFHPIADAESVVRLMKWLVESYLEKLAPQGNALEIYPAAQDRLGLGLVLRKLRAAPQMIGDLRRSRRPPFRDANDLANRFTFLKLGEGELERLMAARKALGVTLNDLFLALLLKALAPLDERRFKAERRRNLSVGCIVNLRKDLGPQSERAFGLFLGSFIVTHPVPEKIPLKTLAREIGERTKQIKRERLYSGMLLELGLGRLALHLFSTARKKKLYQKNYPLWGGITNMNLNAIWGAQRADKPVDYFRAVSTGPATPLVLSITTCGPVVNIGVSYRRTVFSEQEIERVKQGFEDHLKKMEA
jgi:NRPS condensation-like uncharacterized protein